MNAHALSRNAERLKRIRAALDSIAPGDWTRVQDGSGAFIEARGEMPGEVFVLARFSDAATVDEVTFACDAPVTVRFLLKLLDEAFTKIRELRGESAAEQPAMHEPKNFAAECALKCKEPAFKVYLEERHRLERPLSDERVAQKVRSMLGVTSRKQLNDGGEAAAAWKALRADFAAWLKAER